MDTTSPIASPRSRATCDFVLQYPLRAKYGMPTLSSLDPVYGGNPDGIGWKWLMHPPGFPRPPKGKTYHAFLE